MCRSKESEIGKVTYALLSRSRNPGFVRLDSVFRSVVDGLSGLVAEALTYKSGRDGSATDSQNDQTTELNKQEVYMHLQQ